MLAGAALAAAAVLPRLADLFSGWCAPGPGMRVGLAGGFVLFLAIATALLPQGALLQYPPAHAGALILAIETGLTLSLAAILAGLYVPGAAAGRAALAPLLTSPQPPLVTLAAGAISKAWLIDGARAAGMDWAIAVLWISSLLNAAYFLPILWRAWRYAAPHAWPEEHIPARGWRETSLLLLLPPLVTAAATLLLGMFAEAGFSPLQWAQLIAAREYPGRVLP
ncbi:MAG: hypothetical protein IT494_00675 [Gammaproteobacteria bacterium]|nr:hypothetical protein [Gammaproteobacteria bacterium]